MEILFLNNEEWFSNLEVVHFSADVNGERVKCVVTWEALVNHFGRSDEEAIDVFRTNRDSIESIAKGLIQRNRFESDGSILIR